MNKKEYVASQKDCAKLLGISLKEYNNSLKQVKSNQFIKAPFKKKQNDILKKLGLTEKDLKKRVC